MILEDLNKSKKYTNDDLDKEMGMSSRFTGDNNESFNLVEHTLSIDV